jgi:hypothetical protein
VFSIEAVGILKASTKKDLRTRARTNAIIIYFKNFLGIKDINKSLSVLKKNYSSICSTARNAS